MSTETRTFETLRQLKDALPALPDSATIRDCDGDNVPASSVHALTGAYAPYTVTQEAATPAPLDGVQSQLATALMPLHDAPDIENVPAASSMHALMECVTEIYHGVRQIHKSMSPEATAERARALAPLAMELAREYEPERFDVDGVAEEFGVDLTTPAPLDPSKVKAGDTVTLEKGTATHTDHVNEVDHYQDGDFRFKSATSPTHVYRVGEGAWTLTAHQPAPKPEWKLGTSGTATALRTSNVHGFCHLADPDNDGTFAFTSDEGVTVPWSEVSAFVPDETRPLPTRDQVAEAIMSIDKATGNYGLYPDVATKAADAVLALWAGESR